MTSSYGNIFRVTGHLCAEFTGHRWIPCTKASDAELWCFFDLRLKKRLSNQCAVGYLRRHRATAMNWIDISFMRGIKVWIPYGPCRDRSINITTWAMFLRIGRLTRYRVALIINIFTMEISILVRWHLNVKTAPCRMIAHKMMSFWRSC